MAKRVRTACLDLASGAKAGEPEQGHALVWGINNNIPGYYPTPYVRHRISSSISYSILNSSRLLAFGHSKVPCTASWLIDAQPTSNHGDWLRNAWRTAELERTQQSETKIYKVG